MHHEVAQIIQGICSPDLSKVDNARVATLILKDMGHVEISMGKPCLLSIQPTINVIKDATNNGGLAQLEYLFLQQSKITFEVFIDECPVGRKFGLKLSDLATVSFNPTKVLHWDTVDN